MQLSMTISRPLTESVLLHMNSDPKQSPTAYAVRAGEPFVVAVFGSITEGEWKVALTYDQAAILAEQLESVLAARPATTRYELTHEGIKAIAEAA